MYSLSFGADSFDTVTIDRVLACAERPIAVLSEAARVLRRTGRVLVIERCDDIEACTGLNPLPGLRQWLDAAGLKPTRSRVCDFAGGHLLLALARRI